MVWNSEDALIAKTNVVRTWVETISRSICLVEIKKNIADLDVVREETGEGRKEGRWEGKRHGEGDTKQG